MQAAFEDVEFCVRAAKSGLQVAYDGDAVVRHHYDHTAMGLFRCSSPCVFPPLMPPQALLLPMHPDLLRVHARFRLHRHDVLGICCVPSVG